MCLWRPQGQAFWLNDTSDYTAALWRGSGKGRPFPASGFVAQGSVRRQLRAEMSNSEPAPWKVPCEDCPLRRKAVFREFSESELEFVKEFKAGELNVETGTTVLLEGTNSAHLYTVLSGWAFRYARSIDRLNSVHLSAREVLETLLQLSRTCFRCHVALRSRAEHP